MLKRITAFVLMSWCAWAQVPAIREPMRDVCIVPDGDSRTYGYPSSITHADYPSQLVTLIPHSHVVVNLGQPGATSADVFANHILPPITPGCANVYILWVGVGDLVRGWSVFGLIFDVEAILARAEQAGYQTYVLTEPPITFPHPDTFDPDRLWFNHVMLQRADAIDIGSDPAWLNDDGIYIDDPANQYCCGLHPTGAGYGIVARDIVLQLRTNLTFNRRIGEQ